MDTKYVVLRRDPDAQHHAVWRVVSEAEAHNADAACRSVAIDSDMAGVYVAVPARSWAPVEQSKDTTTVWRTKKA